LELLMIEELISRVFATRNAAHLKHWSTKSFAEHEALGGFYEGIIDHIDEIIELYQGAFGLVDGATVTSKVTSDVTAHIAKEAKWMQEHREELSKGACAIENKLDELVALYLRTYYKLTNLS
jgi:hypothetical protein